MAKILIIGAGVSGLSAGIYAQKLGHDTIICEKHSVAGGNLTGWQRNGCVIDNCIHWLTGTNPATKTYKMWCDLNAIGNVEILQNDTLYTCEVNGQRMSLNKNLEKTKQDMLKISQQDRAEIISLINAAEIMQGLCGICGKHHDKGLTAKQTVNVLPILSKYYRLTAGQLADRFSHPLLQEFIRAFWGKDFGALALITVFAHFCGENGGIPRGGSVEMAKRMANHYQNIGGKLLLNKEAIKIFYKSGKATHIKFSDGTVIESDAIIITADPRMVFGKLINIPMPSYLRKQYDDPKLKRFSSYHCAFLYDDIDVPFRGDYIFKASPEYASALHSDNIILREFSHEKSFSQPGKTVIQSLVFCNETDALSFIKLRASNIDRYNRKKQQLANIIEESILKQFPQMSGKLKCIDIWTPATYHRFVNSEIGSFMSFIMPAKKIPFRTANGIKGISNIILATQWQQMPGGLPIAAGVGKLAAEKIDKLMLREQKTAPNHSAVTPITSK